MSVLHLSIATSGLVKSSLSADSAQQPWIVRIAADLATDDGITVDSFAVSIRAEGRKIEPSASRIHGITSAMTERSGIYELFAIGAICGLKAGTKRKSDYPGFIASARTLVCWDAPFVREIISGLFLRHGEPASAWLRPGLSTISLQQLAAPWLRLPAEDGSYRKPTRDEAAAFFADEPARPLPHTVDQNLRLEKLIYAALRERKAFEEIAA